VTILFGEDQMKVNDFTEEKLLNNFRSLAENQKKELFNFLFFIKFHQKTEFKQQKFKVNLLDFEGIMKNKTKLNAIELQHKVKDFWEEKYVSH